MAKILVTGGTGFIGSHVVDLLLSKGHKVIVLDQDDTYLNKKAKFYKGDIRKDAERVIKKEKPAYCIHLAAQVSVMKSFNDPVYDASVNILGSINVLNECAKNKVKKFVYISSCAKYGTPQKKSVDENHPCNPLSPYGISKHAVEHYLPIFKEKYGIDYTIIAPANVYGPRQDPHGEAGVVSIFIDKLMKNKTCTIYGDGKQTRDFVYVKDVAEAIVKALGKTKSKSYNIGSGKETSVNQLFNMLHRLIGKGKNRHSAQRTGDIRNMVYNISKAKKELKWAPKTSLAKGLKETMAWFNKV